MTDKRFWTTTVQRDWLKLQLPAYIEARQSRRLPIYWPTLYALWFGQWPPRKPVDGDATDTEREDEDAHMDVVEDGASEVDIASEGNKTTPEATAVVEDGPSGVDIASEVKETTPEATAVLGKRKAVVNQGQKKKRKSEAKLRLTKEERQQGRIIQKVQQQLRTVMRNLAPAAKRKRKGGGKSTSVFDVGKTSTRRRNPQDVEVYISLYYDARIKPYVTERCKADSLSSVPIGIIREVAADRFASEEQVILDEVDKEIAARVEAATKALEAVEESQRTPEQYQQAIDELPDYINAVARDIHEKAGLAVSVFVGGPIPNQNGQLHLSSTHSGLNQSGHTFGQADATYNTKIKDYETFLRGVYPAEVREARALSFTATSEVPQPPPLPLGLMPLSDEEVSKLDGEDTAITSTTRGSVDEVVSSTPPQRPQLAPNPPSPAPSLSSTPSDPSIKTTLAEPSPSETTDTLTSANLAPVTPDPVSSSPNVNDAQHPQQLKPQTKAQLKARAIKEKEAQVIKEKKAQREAAKTDDVPIIDQPAHSKPRPRPRPRPTTAADLADLNAPDKDNIESILPANVNVWAMPENDQPQDNRRVRRPRALTAEGKRQEAEKAEKEAKRQARCGKSNVATTKRVTVASTKRVTKSKKARR